MDFPKLVITAVHNREDSQKLSQCADGMIDAFKREDGRAFIGYTLAGLFYGIKLAKASEGNLGATTAKCRASLAQRVEERRLRIKARQERRRIRSTAGPDQRAQAAEARLFRLKLRAALRNSQQ